MATRNVTLMAQGPNFLSPVPDSILLNLANVRTDDNKPRKTVFGPLVEQPKGLSSSSSSKKPLPVEKVAVAPSILQQWVEKSKDPVQATTTLHALVNLKTSSLRLFPLTLPESEDGGTEAPAPVVPHDSPHTLEFQYDCDAPKAKIIVEVYAQKKRADGRSSKSAVFSAVFDGGFGRSLKMEDGAMLDLSQYVATRDVQPGTSAAVTDAVVEDAEVTSTAAVAHRKGLIVAAFKKRNQRSDVSGPALRVVDVDAVTEPATLERKKDEVSVRVAITIEALDRNERRMASPNSQTTSLVIVRAGHPESETEEDTRHWTVQVVRRDATIGTHTFRLQDIYGLSSQSKNPAVPPPAASSPEDSSPVVTYPPTAPLVTANANEDDDNPNSECVLCLSSPREVVLLPCRHLVACKECALNMVEYSAGGTVTQPTAEVTDVTPAIVDPEIPTATAGEGSATGAAEGVDSPARQIPRPSRRKRKAKGWHCPICRQPYTSLLRISTSQGKPVEPLDAPNPISPPAAAVTRPGGISGMIASARPSFLRSASRNPSSTNVTAIANGIQNPLQQETV